MTQEIDRFNIEPDIDSTFQFHRIAEPKHTYRIEITSVRVRLIDTQPTDVANGDPTADAERFKNDALKAAEKQRKKLFG
jgi:hypothetical protein